MRSTLDPPVFSGFDSLTADQQSRLLKEALPRFFAAQGEGSAEAVVVCLHGFTGMTYEARSGGRGLYSGRTGCGDGACCRAMAMPQNLNRCGRFPALREMDYWKPLELSLPKPIAAMAGWPFSASPWGGAIALQMAAEQRVDACAVAAPGVKANHQCRNLNSPAELGQLYPDLKPAAEFFYLPRYDFYHSKALRALWQVCRRARNSLTEITCPVYAAHSHNDTTIPPVVMDWLQRDVSDLTYQWFDDSNHVLTRDVDGDEVCRQVAEFFGEDR